MLLKHDKLYSLYNVNTPGCGPGAKVGPRKTTKYKKISQKMLLKGNRGLYMYRNSSCRDQILVP